MHYDSNSPDLHLDIRGFKVLADIFLLDLRGLFTRDEESTILINRRCHLQQLCGMLPDKDK